jgi:hypothetical protein
MVAKINTPHRLLTAINYNENKVKNGKAECIYAGNYLRDVSEMNLYQKLDRLENLNKLNDRANTKTVHISLNFDPKENLSNQKLIDIATDYMNKIGFGEQPYLVYQHNDAGHPHIHIVSSTIKHDGSRINTHNLGRNQSEKARKEIELNFNLVKAEKQKRSLYDLKAVDISKLIYGKTETKRGISQIVTTVMNSYKFTSLPELNAALKQFNVIADRGKEDGVIYKRGGLIYRLLDESGNKVGVPIKASSIYSKPTLSNLEKLFDSNESTKESLKQHTKKAIDESLASNLSDIKKLIAVLSEKQIYTVIRKNAEGRMYGITFVDNKNKCVFNGSDLGKSYSISGIQARILTSAVGEQKSIVNDVEKPTSASGATSERNITNKKEFKASANTSSKTENLLDQLLSVKQQNDNVPFQFKKKKKKKRSQG